MSESHRASRVRRVLRIARLVGLALCVVLAACFVLVWPEADMLMRIQLIFAPLTALIWVFSYIDLTLRDIGILFCLIGLPILAEITCEMGGPAAVLLGTGLIAHIIAKRRRRRLKPTIQRILKCFVASSATASAVLWVLTSTLYTLSIGFAGWHVTLGKLEGDRGAMIIRGLWCTTSFDAFTCGPFKLNTAYEVDWSLNWPAFASNGSPSMYLVILAIPFWLPTLFFAACSYVLWTQPRLNKPGICGECGYDLRGNTTGRCSECGTMCEERLQGAATVEQGNTK